MTEPTLPRIRPEIAALPPYRQGKQAGANAFKLSSNENPFEPLPSVLEALQHTAPINRYPDASAGTLRARLGEKYGVDADAVHVASGSVSILHQLVLGTSSVGDEVIYAWRSFEAYPSLPLVAGATGVQVPLAAGARHDLDAMADAVTDRTRVIIVCTPNNPTGPIVTSAEFAAFVARVPQDVLIILDEAYAEFVTAPDAVDGLKERVFEQHPNVVVLRTFSKAYGLAALRIGYGVGHPAILSAAASVGIPLSVTGIAESAALASLTHEARTVHAERIAEIVRRRDALAAGLRELGLAVPEAQGNFVWIPEGGERGGIGDSQALAAAFAEAGTLVRPFAGHGVRISAGEAESLDEVLRVVRGFLAG